ncbi:MAG: DUF4416 family protein [Pirellulales bacterium]
MGTIRHPTPVSLLVAASSRYSEALAWGLAQAEQEYGKSQAVSDAFAFTETDYYTATMGGDLLKQFWAFGMIDPGALAAIKRKTNDWEAECAALALHPEPRPLNLDPGYLTPAKLVLASTKDHAHRLYLGEGIYAEVTLSFRGGSWQSLPWTYPDYQRGDYQQFFTTCRELILQRAKGQR